MIEEALPLNFSKIVQFHEIPWQTCNPVERPEFGEFSQDHNKLGVLTVMDFCMKYWAIPVFGPNNDCFFIVLYLSFVQGSVCTSAKSN